MASLLGIILSNAVVATVLACLVLAVQGACRRPAVRHSLWLLVLLKLVTPPIWTIPLTWLAAAPPSATQEASASLPAASARLVVLPTAEGIYAEASPVTSVVAESESIPRCVPDSPGVMAIAKPDVAPMPPPESRVNWTAVATAGAGGIWAVGSLLCLGVIVRRVRQFTHLLQYARRANADVQGRAEGLARRLGLSACPGVWFVPGAVCPMLVALGGMRRLVIPVSLWEQLTDRQQCTLLVHELAHLRRRDHWVRMLELAATVLYWWHPVTWWARHELREAEEQCCDAWVLWALPQAVADYATALLEAVDFAAKAQPMPALASGMGEFYHLKRRLTMIKQGTAAKSLSWTGFAGMCGLAVVLLSVKPMLAQQAIETVPLTPAVDAAPAAENVASVMPAADVAVAQAVETAVEAPSGEAAPARAAIGMVAVQAPDDPTAEASEKAINAEAKLAEARAQVQKLSQELKAAQRRLAALEAKRAAVIVRQGPDGAKNVTVVPMPGYSPMAGNIAPLPKLPPMPTVPGFDPVQSGDQYDIKRQNMSQEQRLMELELKLQMLLDAVRSLKAEGPKMGSPDLPTPGPRRVR